MRKATIVVAIVASLLFALTAATAVAAPPAGVGGGKEKVTLCHKGKTMTVASPAAKKGHTKHGDTPGACGTATGGTRGGTTGGTTDGTTDGTTGSEAPTS